MLFFPQCHSGQEHKAHIKCISEEEKYSAKGFVAKPGQNKNERKQTEWVAMVQNVVQSVGNTNDELTNALQRISQHENIPRKKPKFMVIFISTKVISIIGLNVLEISEFFEEYSWQPSQS